MVWIRCRLECEILRLGWRHLYVFVTVVALGLWPIGNAVFGGFWQDRARSLTQKQAVVSLSGSVELVRLVDLCAARLGVNVDYDASDLSGKVVTLRLDGPMTDGELWALTNRILGLHGLTSVQTDPGGLPNSYTIVKMKDAIGLAGAVELEGKLDEVDGGEQRLAAGYSTLVIRLEQLASSTAIASLKPLLSKQGSSVLALGDEGAGLLLVSDLRSRLEQALSILELLDVAGAPTLVRRVVLEHQTSTQLATSIAAITTARLAIENDRLANRQGKVLADLNERSILIVAPEDELDYWESLIAEFDAAPELRTVVYVPRFFGLKEVAELIEQTIAPMGSSSNRGGMGKGGGRVVQDRLTGSLIITATPFEHLEIAALIKRLDDAPMESRRPLRTFQIENRPVLEIRAMLDDLIGTGMLPEMTSNSEVAEDLNGVSASEVSSVVEERLLDAREEPLPTITESVNDRNGGERAFWITADEGTNTLIAVGEPRRLDQLAELIKTLDVRQPQVMIEVMILALSEGDSFDLGVELEKFEIAGSTLINLSSLFGLSTRGEDGIPLLSNPRGGTAVVLNPGDFSVLVRALETINEGRSLNIPKMLVNNNEEAVLNSTLQQPLLSVNASDTVATTSFGGTQDAGTVVTVKSSIAAGDFIVLEYSASLSTFVGESSDPSLPPPRQENSLQSVATIPDGYVVAVGGLDVLTEAEAVSQVPLLGSVPVFGELFKSRSKSQTRARFYVFIRPTILRNVDFEGLKYLSAQETNEAQLDDGWPTVKPRIIR